MDWYSDRPPRNGFPFVENVFHAFHAMLGVVRGGCTADAEAALHESVDATSRRAIEARNVVNYIANFFCCCRFYLPVWRDLACRNHFQIIRWVNGTKCRSFIRDHKRIWWICFFRTWRSIELHFPSVEKLAKGTAMSPCSCLFWKHMFMSEWRLKSMRKLTSAQVLDCAS